MELTNTWNEHISWLHGSFSVCKIHAWPKAEVLVWAVLYPYCISCMTLNNWTQTSSKRLFACQEWCLAFVIQEVLRLQDCFQCRFWYSFLFSLTLSHNYLFTCLFLLEWIAWILRHLTRFTRKDMMTGSGFGARMPGFKSWLCHFWAL